MPTASPPSQALPSVGDAALVARLRAGDPGAETELAKRFGPRMRALCLARTGRPDRAGDLAHDAMIALLIELRRGTLRDSATLPAFAADVARTILATSQR